MKRKLAIVFPIAILVLSLDHLSKWWIDTHLSLADQIIVWQGFFEIVHVRNRGAAFGFMSDASDAWRIPFFYLTSIGALLFLLYYLMHTSEKHKMTLISLGFIIGGAIGNVSDRALRGSVVDFLRFHWEDKVWTPYFLGHSFFVPLSWPAFNVADSAITVGVIVLLISGFKKTQ